MAEVNRQLGKWSYNISLHFKSKRYFLDSRNRGKTVIRSLSVSERLENCEDVGLVGAVNVTAGVEDSYESVTSVRGNVQRVYDQENEDCLRLKGVSPQGKSRSVFPHPRAKVPYGRTFRTFPQQSLCLTHGEFISVRAYSGNGSFSEPLYKTKTGYYDILEVTAKATQAQIKTAYYKQSFIYHPDRNAGSDEATVRFSEISEAYTVLGNKALRKKYDRGLLSQSDLTATVRPSSTRDTAGKSTTQQSDRRRSVMDADGAKSIYDFDKFFKEHYGEQLQRQKDMKARREELQRKKHESMSDKKLLKVTEVGVWAMMAVGIAILISLRRN